MELIYQLNESELDYKLLEAIKVAFKGQKLRISVRAEMSSDASLSEPFEQKVLKNASSDVSYVFEKDEFEQYVKKSLHGKAAETQQFKRVEQ